MTSSAEILADLKPIVTSILQHSNSYHKLVTQGQNDASSLTNLNVQLKSTVSSKTSALAQILPDLPDKLIFKIEWSIQELFGKLMNTV